MRIGVMVGPERGRYATKVERLRADARWAEEAGLRLGLGPADPRRVRRPHRRRASSAPRPTRIEIGTAVVPVQPRHPIALAQQALSVQAVLRRPPRPRPRRVAPLDHRRDARPALRAAGWPRCAPTSTCSTRPSPARARSTSRTSCFRVHNPLDITDLAPTPVLLAALGPKMLRLAGERTDGTILWMADERAIGSHVVPHLTKAAEAAGRPAPRIVAGIPVCVCGDDEVDVAVARTNRILSEAEVSPNYQRLLDLGDARPSATSSPPAASRPSRSACAPSPTPASPTSASASSPSATTATSSSPRATAPAPTSRSLAGVALTAVHPRRHP